MMKRKNETLRLLLSVPITLLADLGLILLGVFLDRRLFHSASATGHPFPVFTLLFAAAAVIFGLIRIILLIRNTVFVLKRRKRP